MDTFNKETIASNNNIEETEILFDVPGDGHCLFYSVALSLLLPYLEKQEGNFEAFCGWCNKLFNLDSWSDEEKESIQITYYNDSILKDETKKEIYDSLKTSIQYSKTRKVGNINITNSVVKYFVKNIFRRNVVNYMKLYADYYPNFIEGEIKHEISEKVQQDPQKYNFSSSDNIVETIDKIIDCSKTGKENELNHNEIEIKALIKKEFPINIEEYFDKMSKSKYGGEPEITAIQKYLEIIIEVRHENASNFEVYKKNVPEDTNRIFLYHVSLKDASAKTDSSKIKSTKHNIHYNFLMKGENIPSSCLNTDEVQEAELNKNNSIVSQLGYLSEINIFEGKKNINSKKGFYFFIVKNECFATNSIMNSLAKTKDKICILHRKKIKNELSYNIKSKKYEEICKKYHYELNIFYKNQLNEVIDVSDFFKSKSETFQKIISEINVLFEENEIISSDEGENESTSSIEQITSLVAKWKEFTDFILEKIESEEIRENFPGLHMCSWQAIPMLSIITGKNGCGKTALLQTIYQALFERLTDEENKAFYIKYSPSHLYEKPIFSFFSSYSEGNQNQEQACIESYEKHFRNVFQDLKKYDLSLKYNREYNLVYTKYKTLYEGILNKVEIDFNSLDPEKKYAENLEIELKNIIGIENVMYSSSLEQYPLKILINKEIEKKFNDFLIKNNFKYQIYFDYTSRRLGFSTEKGKDIELTIPIYELSPGEKMQLLFLFWMFDVNQSKGKNASPILLLDEPDAHLHEDAIEKIMSFIINTLVNKYKVQIIMTTHRVTTLCMLHKLSKNNLFLLENNSNEITIRNPKNIREVVKTLTYDSVHVTRPFKIVFTEGTGNDKKFYEFILKRLRKNNIISSKFDIIFKNEGSCHQVKEAVKYLCDLDEKDKSLKDIAWGIVDQDGESEGKDGKHNIVTFDRYSIENYIFDPVHVFFFIKKHQEKIKKEREKEGRESDDILSDLDPNLIDLNSIDNLLNKEVEERKKLIEEINEYIGIKLLTLLKAIDTQSYNKKGSQRWISNYSDSLKKALLSKENKKIKGYDDSFKEIKIFIEAPKHHTAEFVNELKYKYNFEYSNIEKKPVICIDDTHFDQSVFFHKLKGHILENLYIIFICKVINIKEMLDYLATEKFLIPVEMSEIFLKICLPYEKILNWSSEDIMPSKEEWLVLKEENDKLKTKVKEEEENKELKKENENLRKQLNKIIFNAKISFFNFSSDEEAEDQSQSQSPQTAARK